MEFIPTHLEKQNIFAILLLLSFMRFRTKRIAFRKKNSRRKRLWEIFLQSRFLFAMLRAAVNDKTLPQLVSVII